MECVGTKSKNFSVDKLCPVYIALTKNSGTTQICFHFLPYLCKAVVSKKKLINVTEFFFFVISPPYLLNNVVGDVEGATLGVLVVLPVVLLRLDVAACLLPTERLKHPADEGKHDQHHNKKHCREREK